VYGLPLSSTQFITVLPCLIAYFVAVKLIVLLWAVQ